MKFIWDTKKEKINKRKHKIAFSEACYIFADRYSLTIFNGKHSEDEDRWITMGQTLNGKILVVVHTYKNINDKEFARIISERKATKKEVKQYFERRE